MASQRLESLGFIFLRYALYELYLRLSNSHFTSSGELVESSFDGKVSSILPNSSRFVFLFYKILDRGWKRVCR